MSSVLVVFPLTGAGVLDDIDEVHFVQPIKGVFGRRACDTDGSIGYTTLMDPEDALPALVECEALGARITDDDRIGLAKVRGWVESGETVFLEWRH